MCGLHVHNKINYKSTGATYFYSDRPLPEDPSIYSFVYICVGIKFIDIWINKSDKNIARNSLAYQYKIK